MAGIVLVAAEGRSTLKLFGKVDTMAAALTTGEGQSFCYWSWPILGTALMLSEVGTVSASRDSDFLSDCGCVLPYI